VVLRPDGAEVERTGPGAAKLEGVAARRIDRAGDGVTCSERERAAAAGKLDRRAAGANDGAGIEDADAMALVILMPTDPLITPKLEMPPVKVGPAMATAVPVERISLVSSTRMPWLAALTVPLSTIAPATVLWVMAMPVCAETTPLLVIPPELPLPNKATELT
jgi:hypothetical protein